MTNLVPTDTLTFLFTDVEGSTRLWEKYPVQMEAALERHDDILRGTVEDYGGRVFKMVGDACYAAFLSPEEALRAALAAQRALCAERWQDPIDLRVRKALHTGTAQERSGDYFGRSLNRVARLLSVGHGGQILLSSTTHESMRERTGLVETEARLLDLGEHSLKDLFRFERIYQLAVPDLPNEFPPLRIGGIPQDKAGDAEVAADPDETQAILEVVQQMKDAAGVTGLEADEMSGGRIRVAQKIERAEDVTGAKIRRIGLP